MPDRFVLILAGGRGERFWPWSRPDRPKQLLPLARGGRSLLATTIDRALLAVPADRVWVLTARDLRDAVTRECGRLGVRVLAEPMMRNTAPAIGAIAARLSSRSPETSLAVFPADHAIDDGAAFHADLERAFQMAERDDVLLTFGIRPAGPDTNFGYIRRGDRVGDRLFRVAAFTEKPDRARAEAWVASGEYYWNSGIFVWRCSVFLAALAASRPDLAVALGPLAATKDDAHFERELDRVFPPLESVSVDYAVLEHATNRIMVEAAFDWDDLGSWGAWARRQPRDARGNVVFGDALALDCDDCVVVGEGGTAAAMGLNRMVVVHAEGATLSCGIDASDQIRRVSQALRERPAR